MDNHPSCFFCFYFLNSRHLCTVSETVGTSILPGFSWDISYTFRSNWNPSEWEKNICARYEVNNVFGTCDSNLIEMSVERQGLGIHRICVSCLSGILISSSLLYLLSLSHFLRSELQLHLSAVAEDMHQVSHSMSHSFDPSPQQWRLTLSCSFN